LEDIMAKKKKGLLSIQEVVTANVAAMLREPDPVERSKAKVATAINLLVAKTCHDNAKLGTQRVAASQALDARERMDELNIPSNDPLYQSIMKGFQRGVDAAATGVEKVVGEA